MLLNPPIAIPNRPSARIFPERNLAIPHPPASRWWPPSGSGTFPIFGKKSGPSEAERLLPGMARRFGWETEKANNRIRNKNRA